VVEDRPNDQTSAIDSVAALRARYREPGRLVLAKSIDHVDDGAAAWIGASPFFVLATTSAAGTDASPRGGSPGFVAVLDQRTLAFGDLSGNNRLDSYTNLVEHPDVGLLFFVPGEDETLRVNGRAYVTDEPAVLERCPIDGRIPRVAVVVDVTECFVHCGKAVRRGGLWDTGSWAGARDLPSAAALLNDHLQLGVDPAVIEADLERDYERTLWEPA
jgi:PPOX class probable FMN-dependent enzyme